MSTVQRLTRTLRQVRLSSTVAGTEAPQLAAKASAPPALKASTQGTTSSASPSPSSRLPSSLRSSPPSVPSSSLPTPVFSHHVPLPIKHSIHVATLHLRSHTTSLPSLDFFTQFALRSARALGLPTTGAIALPTRTSLYTVPRSPFAHKKSQENFWRKEHRRAIKVFDGQEEVVGAWLAYLRKEAMGGVGMKAQVFSYRELGWGQKMVGVEQVRESGGGGAGEEAEMVKALARELEGELEEGIKAGEKIAEEKGEGGAQEPKERKELDEVVPEAAAKTEGESK